MAQVVSSCSRPGRTPEVYSGHLSGADRTWMLPPWGLCLPDHPLPQAGSAPGRPRWDPGWTPGRCALRPVSQPLGSEVSDPRGHDLFSHSAAMARATPIKPTPGPPFPRTQVAPPELAPNTPGHIRTDSRAHRGRDRCARVDQELLPAAGDQRRFPRSRFIRQAQVGPAFEQHP